MANYRHFMHPYAEPGFASNPPVLDDNAYPNSLLQTPYPTQSSRSPLATANFKVLKSVADTSLSLTEVFERAEGDPPLNLMELHRFRKLKKEETIMRLADGTDRVIQRPQLRSDLIGGKKDIEPFWALMSVLIDLVIEHVAHQVVTGTPFSPESETEIFLEKIAAKPRFRVYFSARTNTDIMLHFARSALPALGANGGNPSKLWNYDPSTIFKNCISAWVAGQIYSFLFLYITELENHMTTVVRGVVLEEETCGIVPPPHLKNNDTTLPVERMHYALKVLKQIQFHRIGNGISAQELAQEIVFLQSSSIFSATKAIFKKIGLPPIAYMLRKESNSFRIPLEAFSFAAMVIERELCALALSPENFDLRLSEPGTGFLYTTEELLMWSKHTGLIEAAKVGSPPAAVISIGSVNPAPAAIYLTVPTFAMAMLTALRDRLEKLCQLERVASDRGQWS